MTTVTSYVNLNSAQLFTKTWIPATTPIALLVFIHGFSEYIERYDHVFSQFADRGIKTFSWDQRGFGKSAIKKSDWGVTGGTDEALKDIDYFVKKVKEDAQQSKLPIFIWGHSMGGALALMYAANGPEKNILRGVISQSPLIKLVDPPSKVVIFLAGIVCKVLPNFQLHSPVSGKYISRDAELAKSYDEDPLVHGTGTLLGLYTMLTRGEHLGIHPPTIPCPLLIQHGTRDKVTSFKAARDFFSKLPPGNPDREFKGWDGYYHELHNEPEAERKESIRYIADWIIARSDAGQSKAKL